MALTNLVKTVASLTNLVKVAVRGFLLKETGDYLLLETGYKIILEGTANTITNLTKTSA